MHMYGRWAMKNECRHGGLWIEPLPFRQRPAIARTSEDFPMPLSPAIRSVSPSRTVRETSLMRVRLGLFTCSGVRSVKASNSSTTSLQASSTRAIPPPQVLWSAAEDDDRTAVIETMSSQSLSMPSCPSTLPMQSRLMLDAKELAYLKRFFEVSLSPSAMVPIKTMGLNMHIRQRSRMSVYQREVTKPKKDFWKTYLEPGVMLPSTRS
mmetsp:Transcript_92959/g.277439  ORF Transcript_92959/g.277439 Transcript_92959/m.277439 type:complete len:208 (+) Transcript_92959:847-1470(+)